MLHSNYIVREIGFVQICCAEMLDNEFFKVIQMIQSDEMEEATTFFNDVYSAYIRRRISYVMDDQFISISENAESVFQKHARTIHAKAVLKKCLVLIEGEGDMLVEDLVAEYSGKLPVSIANPLPPPPGPSKAGKRPAADVVKNAAAPALKRTAPEPEAAAGAAKKPITKAVKVPTPPEPAAAGGGALRAKPMNRVDPAATAAMPVISKS